MSVLDCPEDVCIFILINCFLLSSSPTWSPLDAPTTRPLPPHLTRRPASHRSSSPPRSSETSPSRPRRCISIERSSDFATFFDPRFRLLRVGGENAAPNSQKTTRPTTSSSRSSSLTTLGYKAAMNPGRWAEPEDMSVDERPTTYSTVSCTAPTTPSSPPSRTEASRLFSPSFTLRRSTLHASPSFQRAPSNGSQLQRPRRVRGRLGSLGPGVIRREPAGVDQERRVGVEEGPARRRSPLRFAEPRPLQLGD